jgi:hypothetical protein
MTTSKENTRHSQSLQAAKMLAKYAKDIQFERNWSYSRASEYVRHKHPDLAEMELKGFVDDTEARHYEFTSLEAGEKIADKAKELMHQEPRLSYKEAVDKVLSNPENKELARCYAAAD